MIDGLAQACHQLEITLDGSDEETLPCAMNAALSASASPVNPIRRGELRIHNHVHACLLRAHAIVLELISSAFKLPDLSRESAQYLMLAKGEITTESQLRANRILNSLVSLLPANDTIPSSWAESLTIMWPLRMIIRSPAPHPESKNIANLALRRIAYHAGLMQALSSFSRHSRIPIRV